MLAATTREGIWRQRLIEHAAIRDGERALDLGCGTGTLASALSAGAPRAEVFGLDADPEALDSARRKASASGRPLQLCRGLAQDLPFSDGSFDLVVSSLFFHHLSREAKRAALRESRRVLRHDGRMLLADWGAPLGFPTRAGFFLVQLLDGFETTCDSVTGAMPELIRQAGFGEPLEHQPVATPLGTVRLWEARHE